MRKYKWNYAEIAILVGLVVTPVAIVWRLLNFDEPHGIYEIIRLVILLIVTGCGGLGIGLLLGERYANIIGKTLKERKCIKDESKDKNSEQVGK